MESRKGIYLMSLISSLIILFIILQGHWILKDYRYYTSQPLFSTGLDFYIQQSKQPVSVNSQKLEKNKIVLVTPAKRGLPDKHTSVQETGVIQPILITSGLTRVSGNNSIALKRLPTIATPIDYVKDKAIWQFGYSLILLVAISGWLIYMLFFIFRQRRNTALKNEFIDNMAHELLTPITNIGLAVEGIKDYGIMHNPFKRSLYLDVCKREADHLSLLVERILQQSMFDTGVMILEKRKTEINVLIDKLLLLYSIDENIKIVFKKHLPQTSINIDPIHISNIIKNLIDNALKYSEHPASIIIISKFDRKFWMLSITDHGIGIERKHQKNIFRKFYRIKNPTIKKNGFGLGLNYVKQVAELHGGKVTVDSSSNGSTFRIYIPI